MAVRNRLAAIFDLSDTTMSPREEFSRQTQDALAKRVGFRCAICRCATSGPHEDPTKTVNVGVAAHISAASPGGPRYDPQITSVERAGIRNGIWLCQKHAKLVDSDPIRFTVEWLQQLKARAEQATRLELEARSLTCQLPETFSLGATRR
jgi:hypothetical protein